MTDTEKLAETMKQLAPDVPFPWQFGDAHSPDCIVDADGAPIAQFFGPNKDRLQAMQTVIVAVNTLAGYKAEIVPANLAHDSRAQPASVADGWASIEFARNELVRVEEMLLPYCDCQPCPECGKLPNDCTGTPCADTCQCSMCGHCRVVEAKDSLSAMLTTAPQPPAKESE